MHSETETEAISDSVKRKWGGSGSAGAKNTDQGGRYSHMSALALVKLVQKFRRNSPNIFELEHLIIFNKL